MSNLSRNSYVFSFYGEGELYSADGISYQSEDMLLRVSDEEPNVKSILMFETDATALRLARRAAKDSIGDVDPAMAYEAALITLDMVGGNKEDREEMTAEYKRLLLDAGVKIPARI